MNPPDTPPTPPGFAARILVVDDDEAIRRLTRRILEDQCYRVLTSSDGAAALETTRLAMMQPDSPVHLVLTDLDMPGMGGYALGRRLARRWPALPVVYMSGTTVGLAGREPLERWDHFIAKPFSATELLAKLHLALGTGITTATGAARAAVAYLDDEARWALLQQWLGEESAGLREAGKRSPRLEALRCLVSPRVSDREWDRVVREHWPVRWAEQLRLANALACARSEPGGQA